MKYLVKTQFQKDKENTSESVSSHSVYWNEIFVELILNAFLSAKCKFNVHAIRNGYRSFYLTNE